MSALKISHDIYKTEAQIEEMYTDFSQFEGKFWWPTILLVKTEKEVVSWRESKK